MDPKKEATNEEPKQKIPQKKLNMIFDRGV